MENTFAERMSLAIKEAGKTLQQIADLAGTSKGQVSQWQTAGKVQVENIKAHVLERVCEVLKIRPRWLMYGEQPMRPARNAGGKAAQLWDTYSNAPVATQAAVDLLLQPISQRKMLENLAPRAFLGIELLEEYTANPARFTHGTVHSLPYDDARISR